MHYQQILADVERTALSCNRNPSEITVIAVSKGHPWNQMQEAYEFGCRAFGENRLQEVEEKQAFAPKDIQWHFIGSLQRNKVRKAIGRFYLIHSVDTLELAQKISSCSQEAGLVTSILLEINVSGEFSKHGLSPRECLRDFESFKSLQGIEIKGLMTMAPLTEDDPIVRSCFSGLRHLRDQLGLAELSMGMSHDYRVAIQEGATFLRIGTSIFA